MVQHRKMIKCFMNGKSCIYERIIDERIAKIKAGKGEKKAFVLMPFAPYMDALYQWQLVPFLQKGGKREETDFICVPERADDVRQIGYIICEKICRKIQEANLIAADLSYNNPNVFYELGISIALRKPILPLCIDHNKSQRDNDLKQYFNINKTLACPSFGFLEGEISTNLIDYSLFSDFDLLGKSLLVLHDGKEIEADYKFKQDLKYSFASLCKSAAGTAIDQIFSDSNLKQHPELRRYSDINPYKNIIDINLRTSDFDKIVTTLKESFCVLIDTSSDFPAAYFWLGYIHAIGGFAIPINITDKTDKKETDERRLAFDIRALWHIYFNKDNPSELVSSLKDILEFVFIEKSKYLNRDDFWKKILKHNKVSIFLGSVNIPELGRNTIGDWDYRTAAELTSFLSSAKETMEVTLESPIQKVQKVPSADHREWLEKQLENKNCIIVASSDVNDLTEIALAALWGKEPFKSLDDNDANFNDFIAFKSYKKDVKPMPPSAFFRYETNPAPQRGFLLRQGNRKNEQQIVEDHFFPDEIVAEGVHILLGQLIVAKNPFPRPHGSDNWIIVISGISGPATLGIAQMLTGCVYSEFTVNSLKTKSEQEFNTIVKWLEDSKNRTTLGISDNTVAIPNIAYDAMSEQRLEVLNLKIKNRVCALISVGVYYPQMRQSHDERKIVAWNFTNIKEKIGANRENPLGM
ncbi:MAG: hypothetical protein FD156_2461 [Nitrospirae bacterium]|nr:MAG: hypothetical protein FD156_2461 [Nitrospirota bacterium]